MNYQIRVPEVRVVASDGEQLGVMATQEAIRIAEEEGFDLVEVSPTSRPPVCRIMDYGKYKYEKNKRERASKKKQHVIQVKEVKFRPKTEEHDYQFKTKHARQFLEKMNKVKFTVIFRGRELDHKELGMKMLKRAAADLEEFGFVERSAMFEGRLMTMIMAPHPAKPGQQPKKKKDSGKPKDVPKPAPAAANPAPAADAPKEAAAEKPAAEQTSKAAPENAPAAEPAPKDAPAETPEAAPPAAEKSDSGEGDTPKEG